MGEAKRKAAARARATASRSWATGTIEVTANDLECFTTPTRSFQAVSRVWW